MNRKNFALTYLGAIPVLTILVYPLEFFLGLETAMIGMILLAVVALAIMWVSVLRRLENIGKSKLWFLGIFIPLLNMYAVPMIWSYPSNIKEHGMDKKGYAIFILMLLVVVATMVLQIVINTAESQG